MTPLNLRLAGEPAPREGYRQFQGFRETGELLLGALAVVAAIVAVVGVAVVVAVATKRKQAAQGPVA